MRGTWLFCTLAGPHMPDQLIDIVDNDCQPVNNNKSTNVTLLGLQMRARSRQKWGGGEYVPTLGHLPTN